MNSKLLKTNWLTCEYVGTSRNHQFEISDKIKRTCQLLKSKERRRQRSNYEANAADSRVKYFHKHQTCPHPLCRNRISQTQKTNERRLRCKWISASRQLALILYCFNATTAYHSIWHLSSTVCFLSCLWSWVLPPHSRQLLLVVWVVTL